MATWRVDSAASTQWTTNHAYSLNDRVVCRIAYGTQTARAFVYECTTAGTSHATTEPTWPLVVGNTVNDNGVIWTCRSPSDGTWANASCILLYVVNHAYAAGDAIYVDDGHAESVVWTSTTTYSLGNTISNPVKIYCVDKADDSLSVGAVVTNNANQRTVFSGNMYCYGVQFKHTASTNNVRFESTGGDTSYLCVFEGDGTTNALYITASVTTAIGIVSNSSSWTGHVKLINTGLKMDGQSYICFIGQSSFFEWIGGTLTCGASGLANLFQPGSSAFNKALVRDVDLTQCGNGGGSTSLVKITNGGYLDFTFLRCKLSTSGTFSPAGVDEYTGKIRLHHCSGSNNTYDFIEYSTQGTVEDETTIVRTGGAQHGATGISYKMGSSANTLDNLIALESPPIQSWTDGLNSSATFTVECIVDSATNLQNDEVWMELEYPANNANGLGAIARDKCAILGTPADKTPSDSGIAWTTTGMANPNLFVCQVTVTPGKAGPITARICLAKASSTIYIDPIITES